MIRLAIILLVSALELRAATPALEKLRSDFSQAATSESKADSLFQALQSKQSKDALTGAYLAATEALLAKYAFLPTTKYTRCRHAMEGFKSAVAADPEQLEIRYLRIAVQTNLPSFLDMSNDIETDRRKILLLLPNSTDHQLQKSVATLLIDKKLCSPEETARLKKYLH